MREPLLFAVIAAPLANVEVSRQERISGLTPRENLNHNANARMRQKKFAISKKKPGEAAPQPGRFIAFESKLASERRTHITYSAEE
jgi:hypothetical protein